ncbi:MAG: sulfatase-like hydrolase/transferase, partial [Verrucomicrobia bacterium]|nr:sulfatase-like hydrolase/transferase [Verrucomicrobiota bacterium]
PLCGPSRCQFLTGRYPFRTGLINNQSHNAVSPTREVMIPTVLNKAGYSTASVGKWGQICLGPGPWGFEEYLFFPGSGRYWRDQTKFYTLNGERKNLEAGTYLPDVMHKFVVDFLTHHKDQPFFLYYPMSHVHGPIVPTPDSKAGAGKDQLYADNVVYMDKLVGQLIAELDRLRLREKTLVLFCGDNGTARFGVQAATVHGRAISGMKATMLEGGSRVPLLANWPGVTPAGRVNHDLIDFSDFFTTFAELAGAPLPAGVTLDGHSFAGQIRGEKGTPREWVYVELNGRSYARDARYKLTHNGALFDLAEAPFKETPIPLSAADPAALAARERLQKVLADHPTATGSDKAKTTKKAAKKRKARQTQ